MIWTLLKIAVGVYCLVEVAIALLIAWRFYIVSKREMMMIVIAQIEAEI